LDQLPLSFLIGALVALLFLSACFSGSETALMTLNRYRARHRAREGHRGSRLALHLLDQPDRLIGLILLGNNFVNVLASMIATLIALRIWDESALGLAAIVLTLLILIFSEVAPKTFAALHPEAMAMPAAYVYTPLLRVLYPLVWGVNLLSNTVLRIFGIRPRHGHGDSLSAEELRSVVNEAGTLIPKAHQEMLVNVLDLQKVTIDDIIIPRSEILGVDLDEDWDDIRQQLTNSANSRLPVYHENIDNIVGFLFLRDLIGHDLRKMSREDLMEFLREPYFVPEGTPLTRQLLNFQHQRRRVGMVVDEYGDILGMVTLEDILEEIVGEFTTDRGSASREIRRQTDGSYMCAGGTHMRDLARLFEWQTDGVAAKTLNGLILEHMELIPEPGTTFLIEGYPVEVVQTRDNGIRSVRIYPRLPNHDEREPGPADIPLRKSVREDED